MKNRAFWSLPAVGLTLALSACSAGSADPVQGTAATTAERSDGPAPVLPLALGCMGAFVCKGSGIRDEKIKAVWREQGCDFDGVLLRWDGSVEGSSGRWEGNSSKVDLYAPAGHLECVRVGELGSPRRDEAKCSGTPDYCGRKTPGSCWEIQGCRMESHVNYDGTFTNTCEGWPDDCDDFTDKERCLNQGCDWK